MRQINENCDSHFHIFGPKYKYPYTEERLYTPKDASLKEFFNTLDSNNIEKAVIIQPSVYGFDNSAIIDALKANPLKLRGIVVIEDTHDYEELKKWHDYGVRGVRLNLLFSNSANVPNIKKLAKLIKPLGWHLELLINISTYENLYDEFSNIDVDVVFDHMGNFDISKGMKQTGFLDMLRLLNENKAWIKLSGEYTITKEVQTEYTDIIPFAKEIINTNEDRIVWASNWPHPTISVSRPRYSELLNLIVTYTNKESVIKKIMQDNPEKLYGF